MIMSMTDTLSRPASHGTAFPSTSIDLAQSPSPRRTSRASWLDVRLLLGVGLVLVSVLLGAAVVSRADHRVAMWGFTTDLDAGTVLKASDLRVVAVQLGSASERYVPSDQVLVGQQLLMSVHAGELVSRAGFGTAAQGVTVSMPLELRNAPPSLSAGDRITVWASGASCGATAVLSGVTVQQVKQGGGSGFGNATALNVVLRLRAEDAAKLVAVMSRDKVILRVGLLSVDQSVDKPADSVGCTTGLGQ